MLDNAMVHWYTRTMSEHARVSGPVGYTATVRNVRVAEVETVSAHPEVEMLALKDQCLQGIRQLQRIVSLVDTTLRIPKKSV